MAITAGVRASSIALTGFGLDSVIELFAAIIVVWQLRGEIAGQQRETRAVQLIGLTFFALAAYLAAESIHDLVTRARPGESIPGLAVTAAALIVMPALAIAKRRTGQALGNRTLVTESAETAFCAYTSAATLAGVGLNTVPVPNGRRAIRRVCRSPGPVMFSGLPSAVSRPCSRRHRWMIAGRRPQSSVRAKGVLWPPERCRRWIAAASSVPRQILVRPWKLPRAPTAVIEAPVCRSARPRPGSSLPASRRTG